MTEWPADGGTDENVAISESAAAKQRSTSEFGYVDAVMAVLVAEVAEPAQETMTDTVAAANDVETYENTVGMSQHIGRGSSIIATVQHAASMPESPDAAAVQPSP